MDLAPEPFDVLVAGCGNLLRGDDGVGPILVRRLAERGVPAGVHLVDGGTAGMEVAFAMRGAHRVVIVDAARTGAPPGTVFRVPGSELATLPPPDGHLHAFRWDHALGFAHWALGAECPTDVTVYLVEVDGVEPGSALSPAAHLGMAQVIDRLEHEVFGPLREAPVAVEEAS